MYKMDSPIDFLVDYSVEDVPNVMEVRTEILEPTQSSAYRHTFRIDQSGFLDENTMLLFKPVASAAAAAAGCRLNCWNGALGAIDRVTLQVGDYMLQDINKVGIWAAVNRLYTEAPDKQTKLWAHYLHNCLRFKVLDEAGAVGNALTGSIQVDGAKSGIDYGDAAGGGAAVRNAAITAVAANNLRNAIPLGLIVPALKGVELPLFLFQDYRVNIIVEFNPRSSEFANRIDKINFAAGENMACDDGDITFSEVQLLMDYLIYPSSVQDEFMKRTQQEGGYTMDFMNVVTVEKQLPAAPVNVVSREEHRIGLANSEVHYVQLVKKLTAATDAGQNKVLLGQRSDSVSIESTQWTVNGVDVYPEPYFNPVSHYNGLSYVLGVDYQVPKPLCVMDSTTEYSLLTNVQSGIHGKSKVIGLDLSTGAPGVQGSGRETGQYPIIFKYARKPHGNIDITLDGAGGTKLASADDSAMECDYFCGLTRLVNVRMLPSGGLSVVVSNN
jgi:hypothetical protein